VTADDRELRKKKRKSILDKIRALLAKTVENGATEGEALAAAEKAAAMMKDHDLSMDEVDVKESGLKSENIDLDRDMATYLAIVANAIGRFCETRFWTDYLGRSANCGTFFGLPHDVEISLYLYEVCQAAMAREVKAYEPVIALHRMTVRNAKRRSFLGGMADRLAERLDEMAAARKQGTGTSLVPLKNALIDQALADNKMKFKSGRFRFGDLHLKDLIHGRKAGDKVSLNPAICEDEEPAAIEATGNDEQLSDSTQSDGEEDEHTSDSRSARMRRSRRKRPLL